MSSRKYVGPAIICRLCRNRRKYVGPKKNFFRGRCPRTPARGARPPAPPEGGPSGPPSYPPARPAQALRHYYSCKEYNTYPTFHSSHTRQYSSQCSPYRHPFAKKNEIEKIVHELLEAGVIYLSTSLYSSLVVMVLKKEGTWCMCPNFHALNKLTIKDKFPNPFIDDLLEELSGAQ
jgi:hypothetical protein